MEYHFSGCHHLIPPIITPTSQCRDRPNVGRARLVDPHNMPCQLSAASRCCREHCTRSMDACLIGNTGLGKTHNIQACFGRSSPHAAVWPCYSHQESPQRTRTDQEIALSSPSKMYEPVHTLLDALWELLQSRDRQDRRVESAGDLDKGLIS